MKYSSGDQLNAMTTLVTSLLRALDEQGVLKHDEVRSVVRDAADMCGRSAEGIGSKFYLEEMFLNKMGD